MAGIEEQELKRTKKLNELIQKVNQIKIEGGQVIKQLQNLERHIQRVDEKNSEMVGTLERELLQVKKLLRLNLRGYGAERDTTTSKAAAGQASINLSEEHEMSNINRGISIDGMLLCR